MEKLKFYNVKTKKKFSTATYKTVTKGGRHFAVAKNGGIDCYRIIGKKK